MTQHPISGFQSFRANKKFDKAHTYINKWIEDLNELTYPQPIVDHPFARNRAIETYKIGLENSVPEIA
ncbi:MAG: hypothetical protein CM15mP65_09270 [Crocinitomicaceae bacterium]|nr:MAG: hypothetical protein CM15mP65_09270 [Crocinitomicaceae bacterium]